MDTAWELNLKYEGEKLARALGRVGGWGRGEGRHLIILEGKVGLGLKLGIC